MPEITQSLRALLTEYSNSLTRIEAEKDLLKAIAEGVDQNRLRPEIREATYNEFEKVKGL